jgi:hypothetical protein
MYLTAKSNGTAYIDRRGEWCHLRDVSKDGARAYQRGQEGEFRVSAARCQTGRSGLTKGGHGVHKLLECCPPAKVRHICTRADDHRDLSMTLYISSVDGIETRLPGVDSMSSLYP